MNKKIIVPLLALVIIITLSIIFWPRVLHSIVSLSANSSVRATAELNQICNGYEQDFDCYEKYYRSLAMKANGIKLAFNDLKRRYAINGYVQSQCHPLTHVIGQAAVERFPNVADAYTQGDSFCWSGYYHGVMEGIVGRVGREQALFGLDNICADIPGKATYSFDYYNCVHGLGHGLMAISNDELFESLHDCNVLTGSWERGSCYSGVFMENVIVDGKNHFTKYLKPKDPLYPCNAVDDPYKQACYLMQTSYMLKVSNRDFRKLFDWCEKADAGYVDTCYQSAGRDASGSTVSNLIKTKELCLLGHNTRQRSNCVIGAVKDFISYFHSDVQARELCAALPSNLQKVCLDTAVSYYKSF
ncbi:MAG: hypothetical protein Q7N87_01090 [Candidatus Uhrbacteria bacterium]|nr:hypothetical protein [Candidatus Uhrbacteria bacterium]